MIPDGLTILPCLPALSFFRAAIQLQLTRDHCLREIAFADEIRHHADLANRFRIKQKQCIPQTRFLLPEGARDGSENFSASNFDSVRERRRTRIWIYGRAVGDDEESVVVGSHGRNVQQPALSASRMGPPQLSADVAAGEFNTELDRLET
jgi:hypothetical protein